MGRPLHPLSADDGLPASHPPSHIGWKEGEEEAGSSASADTWRNYKWSGKGGWIVLRRVAGIHCVHYIKQKACTARFATGAIWEIPDYKLNQVAPATQAGRQRRAPLGMKYTFSRVISLTHCQIVSDVTNTTFFCHSSCLVFLWPLVS